jgi:hypothetical protein
MDHAILITYLGLLISKHTVCDYFLQTMFHIRNKGIYGAWGGLCHSTHHAVGTLLVTYTMTLSWHTSAALAIIDGVTHYHIDYIKTRFGPQDINHPDFWKWFGVDQGAHMLTYLCLACIINT